MPDARPCVEPLSAGESSTSDEVSRLQLQSQRQLEDDIARIFDESIYSDLEVVCGKLKILTHSCILKARTHKFYHKLEAILHVNIGHNTFDEIYSFISDAYTECNIQQEESKIIDYINKNINIEKNHKNSPKNKPEQKAEPEVYLTPNCVSPEEKSYQKTLSSSPSTELTKEYYALVPLEGNVLDRELIEQDALSNAFQSINKSQDISSIQCVKPTSLCLNYSRISKKPTHSHNCDILKKSVSNNELIKKVIVFEEKKLSNGTSQSLKTLQRSEADKNSIVCNKTPNFPETSTDKSLDPTYTPDSLITDEPSSSSDYLSATYAASPGTVFSSAFSQLNAGENSTKMDNVVTITDSGLETPGMLESLNSHKDITLADVSLTDSALRDMINDDNNCQDMASNSTDKSHVQLIKRSTSSNSPTCGPSTGKDDLKFNKSSFPEVNNTSTKEEKQRHNEEIVILESSSLSSETASWESVFPLKLSEKELCVTFIENELKNALEGETRKISTSTKEHDDLCQSLVQKSPFKSTSCFIDAASLADECGEVLKVQDVITNTDNFLRSDKVEKNQAIPKQDLSPSDWSGSNDNDDSLEQTDNKEPVSLQKYSTPTIHEISSINKNCSKGHEVADHTGDTTITQESMFSGNGFVQALRIAEGNTAADTTPNNSIVSVNASDSIFDIESLSTRANYDTCEILSQFNCSSSSRSCTSYTEDEHSGQFHDTTMTSLNDLSIRRQVENKPIVSGAYIPEPELIPEKSPRAPSSSSFWVVDMSSDPIQSNSHRKPDSEPVHELRSTSKSEIRKNGKSMSSVDSDSSEKSTHNFYVDLSTLPDFLTPIPKDKDEGSEKRNMFSMFVDLSDNTATAKEKPTRFTSTPIPKKTIRTDKHSSKGPKMSESKNTKPHSITNQSADENILFETLETLCNDPNISIIEILNKPEEISVMYNDLKQKVIQEEPPADEPLDLYVKLSDLDKPSNKAEPVANSDNSDNERMSKSIPDNNWRETDETIDNRSREIISSFHSENALSLNRLFPNLKTYLSQSVPGSLSKKTRSPLRHVVSFGADEDITKNQVSGVSKMTSVQNISRSVAENALDSEEIANLINSCNSRLGQDLLRMFLKEVDPDVIVEVSGRRIKAHKCILSSRCHYFARILSGGWVESAGNVISLMPFRFNVVHFALCHIYSGVCTIPKSISIVELATLTDMLGLDGLKESIMCLLKDKYCHHFHKPCDLCTAGGLECLTLCSVYALDDLYRKCLRWVTKYFRQVWPTKAFATLPSELMDKCCHEQILNLTTENLVDTVYGCGMIMWSLGKSRWAEAVARLCRRLLNASAQFTALHLCDVLCTMRGMPAPPDTMPAAVVQALHDCLSIALERASVEDTCRAYMMLCPLVKDARVHHHRYNNDGSGSSQSLLTAHAAFVRMLCERMLVRNGPRVVNTKAFGELPDELRYRLRSLGCITFGSPPPLTGCSPRMPRRPRASPAAPSTSASATASTPAPSAAARALDVDLMRKRCLPYTTTQQPHLGSVDSLNMREKVMPTRAFKPRDERPGSKMIRTYPPNVRSTKAQEERAKFNSIKTNQTTERQMGRAARATYEHTKPRYMEPRQPREKPPALPARKSPAKKVSSSDSSRNSSPVLRYTRAPRPQPNADPAHAPRPRTALTSTDSLPDKYATYTKAKHNTKGSVEEINTLAENYSRPPSNTRSLPVTAPNGKIPSKATKIPVSINNKIPKSLLVSKENQRRVQNVAKNLSPIMQRNIPNERKPSGSLMNATKSSQAKVVSKTIKETNNARHASSQDRNHGERPSTSKEAAIRSTPTEIPIMERSGTFLKDEPSLDITKNIDIDE